MSDYLIEGWVCENPECGAVYAEYVNGCPECWHKRNELVSGVRHQGILKDPSPILKP